MDRPNCYGKWWEAIPGPAGDLCRRCVIARNCLREFATKALPKAFSLLGPEASLSDLATHLEVDNQAVLIAMAYNPEDGTRMMRPRQTPVDPPGKPKAGRKKKKRRPSRGTPRRMASTDTAPMTATDRERLRHPEIASLTPGTSLKKLYKGSEHAVTVLADGYAYNDTQHATLASLARKISGYPCGAVKFWGLRGKGGK